MNDNTINRTLYHHMHGEMRDELTITLVAGPNVVLEYFQLTMKRVLVDPPDGIEYQPPTCSIQIPAIMWPAFKALVNRQ